MSAKDVREEWARFEAALPRLLDSDLKGRWVVFKDGEVQAISDSLMAAYSEGVRLFGQNGGQVIAEVKELTQTPVTAGAIYIHAT